MSLRGKIFTLSKPFLPRKTRMFLTNLYVRTNNLLKYKDWHLFSSVSIEISVFCNRTCSYCPNTSYETPKEFMTEEMYDLVLKRLAEMNYTGIVDFIFYNEPLLDKRLPDLVKKLKTKVPNCLPRVTTNGDALTENLLLTLVKNGILTFYVTRHVPSTDAWDKRIIFLKEKYPQYVTVTDIRDVEKNVGLWNRAGLVKVNKEYKVKACHAPSGALTIDRNGNVVLCCCDYFRKNIQGNITKNSILEIWRSPTFVNIRKNLRRGIPILEICRNCILRLKK